MSRRLLATALVLAAACSGSGSSTGDADRVQQGGALTVFDATSLAYDMPAPEVRASPDLFARFLNGDRLYGLERVASPALVPGTGGLGPLYCGRSCTSCHQGSGRTNPTLFTNGGTGFDFSSFLTFMTSKSGAFFPAYGRVLHDHAVFGVQPEGRLHAEYTETCAEFPTEDHERYCLVKPRYWITDWYTTPPPADELVMSVRTPLRHVGLGLLLAVDQDELRTLASKSYPEYGITPKLQWVLEHNVWGIGIGGHKAQHSDLTVQLGFSSDLGVTSNLYPNSVAKGQPQVTVDEGIEVSDSDMADVDFYLHTQGVPARRNANDPVVRRGGEMFERAKCHLCHVPTLHTSATPPKLIDGTPMPMLAGQTIHPYTDLLLHDMGPELGDAFSQFEATGDEWRTAPLWGGGLQQLVNGHTHYLHDGRARNLLEAIMWHREKEGAASFEVFLNMPKADRDALMSFVLSL
jgi:CxxC motif-containing protein (DUF1111 family)